MNSTTITIKTTPQVKKEAQKTAEALGLSLSAVLNDFLKRFAKTKTLTPTKTFEDEIPNARTLANIRQSEEDIKAGKTISFETPEDAITYVSSLIDNEKTPSHTH